MQEGAHCPGPRAGLPHQRRPRRAAPSHNLPFYQRRDPTYGTYAIEALARLAANATSTLVINIGANVGDTAVAALSAAKSISVVSVEGASAFTPYLRRNLDQFGDRARVVEGFVGPVGSDVTFSDDGSTGGFQPVERRNMSRVMEWVTPTTLLPMAGAHEQVIWKSDIDGFDIHVLEEHWDALDARCSTIWFEFDPASTLGEREDIGRLIDLIGDSGRALWIHDNLGRRILSVAGGDAARSCLQGLTEWLVQQRGGHAAVGYLDVWAVRESASAG